MLPLLTRLRMEERDRCKALGDEVDGSEDSESDIDGEVEEGHGHGKGWELYRGVRMFEFCVLG